MVWWYVLRMITQEQAETRDHVPPQIGNTHNTEAHRGAHWRTAGTLEKLGPTGLDLDLALSGSTKVASTVSLEG